MIPAAPVLWEPVTLAETCKGGGTTQGLSPLHPMLLLDTVPWEEQGCHTGLGAAWGRHIGPVFRSFGCLSAPTSFVKKDEVTWGRGVGAQVQSLSHLE